MMVMEAKTMEMVSEKDQRSILPFPSTGQSASSSSFFFVPPTSQPFSYSSIKYEYDGKETEEGDHSSPHHG